MTTTLTDTQNALELTQKNIAFVQLHKGVYSIVYRGDVTKETKVAHNVYNTETIMGNVNVSQAQKMVTTFDRKSKDEVAIEVDELTAKAVTKKGQVEGMAGKVSGIVYDDNDNVIGWVVWFNGGK